MKLSRIDIIGQNGNDGEHYADLDWCGGRWQETGYPWPQPEKEEADAVAQGE